MGDNSEHRSIGNERVPPPVPNHTGDVPGGDIAAAFGNGSTLSGIYDVPEATFDAVGHSRPFPIEPAHVTGFKGALRARNELD